MQFYNSCHVHRMWICKGILQRIVTSFRCNGQLKLVLETYFHIGAMLSKNHSNSSTSYIPRMDTMRNA